jgi:pimeloyl-ACP methyl ester carboxylesterase
MNIRAHLFRSFLLCILGACPSAFAATSNSPLNPPAIVIGFVGGFVKHDNMVHSEVQLAAELRAAYPSDVYAGAFENHHREKAYEQILRLLDTDHDGTLTAQEKQKARIIIFGHSWGGAETLALARELGGQGIPVLLTVQVDSVSKFGENDKFVPANVSEAVNFYQRRGLIRSQKQIEASDPRRTKVLGNILFDYKGRQLPCDKYPWWDRYIVKAHTQIECDPKVWSQVDSLIRSKLPPPETVAAASSSVHSTVR